MTEQFTYVKYEAYIGGTWVDISADVLADPHPQLRSIGMMHNGPLDRMADAGQLLFSLNNSQANIGKKIGYYTPGNSNCLTGWDVGVPIRVRFKYTGGGTALGYTPALAVPVLGATLWDAAAGIFTSGTYAWSATGNAAVSNVSNTLRCAFTTGTPGYCAELLNNAADLSADLVVGQWYELDIDTKVSAGASTRLNIQWYDGSWHDNLEAPETSTNFVSHKYTFRATDATHMSLRVDGATGTYFYIDNLALKPLTFNDLFAFPSAGNSLALNQQTITVQANQTSTAGMWAGLAICADVAEPNSCILVITDGQNLRVTKYISGTYTDIIAPTPITYSAGAVIKATMAASGANMLLNVFYNGSQVGTQQTITDAVLVAGPLHGLFQTDTATTFANLSVSPLGDFIKFRGYIAPNGLTTDPGIYSQRSVQVVAENYAAKMINGKINLLAQYTDLTVDAAVPYLLANMPFLPQSQQYDPSSYTNQLPTVFDGMADGSSPASEITRLCTSAEPGAMLFVTGDQATGERLFQQNRSTVPVVNDTTLWNGAQALFDNCMLPGSTKISYGNNYLNKLYMVNTPSHADAGKTAVVFTLNKPFSLEAGEVRVIRGKYRDVAEGPNFISAWSITAPVSGTDWTANTQSNGGGTNKTSNTTCTAVAGATSVEFTITNNDAGAVYITTLQVRAGKVKRYDPVTTVFDDLPGQTTHGVVPLNVSMVYQDDTNYATRIGGFYLNYFRVPQKSLDAVQLCANRDVTNMLGFLQLEPGTRATFKETVNGISGSYYINGYDAEFVAGANGNTLVYWTPCLADLNFYLPLIVQSYYGSFSAATPSTIITGVKSNGMNRFIILFTVNLALVSGNVTMLASGETFTQLSTASFQDILYLASKSETSDIVANAATPGVAVAIFMNNVNTAAPVGAVGDSIGTSANPSVTVACNPGDLVFASLGAVSAFTVNSRGTSPKQTNLVDYTGPASRHIVVDQAIASGTSVTFSWVLSGSVAWEATGVAVKSLY